MKRARFLGITDDITVCGCCGRTDIKEKTINHALCTEDVRIEVSEDRSSLRLSKMFCATPLTKDGLVPKNVYRSPLTCGTLEEARQHAGRTALWNPGKIFVVVDANNEIVDRGPFSSW